MFKTFFPPQTDGMIRSSFNIGCSESKVIFNWRKTNKNNNKKRIKRLYRPLQGANVRTSCISQTNTVDGQSTHRKARREPAIRDAQKLAQDVFPPWTLTLGVRAKEGKGGGGGEKKTTPARYHCSFGKLRSWQTELLIGAALGSRLMHFN